jgi:cell division protein FtsQ
VSEPRGTRKRKQKLWRTAFFGLIAVGLIAGVSWAFLGSRLLVVRSVAVSGNHLVPTAEVLAAADVATGTPLVRVDTAQVAARVDAIRQVRGAQVVKSWPDRLVIEVTERTPRLAVAAPGGGYDLVDPAGVVVRWSASRPGGMPAYETTGPVASLREDPGVSLAVAVLGELPAGLRSSVVSVFLPSAGEVALSLGNGETVVWGGTDRAGEKAAELAILMRTTSARYYDVSAPGMAMTKG